MRPYRVTPYFKGHEKTNEMVCLKTFAILKKTRPKRVWISTHNKGRQILIFRVIRELFLPFANVELEMFFSFFNKR